MAVKDNQPQLLEEVRRLFADPVLVAATGTTDRRVSKGHGRLEVRRLWSSGALVGYSAWPGLAQALCLEREVVRLNTGEVRRDRAYAVTSLPPEQADAGSLLTLWRGHWGIENQCTGSAMWALPRTAQPRGSVRCPTPWQPPATR